VRIAAWLRRRSRGARPARRTRAWPAWALSALYSLALWPGPVVAQFKPPGSNGPKLAFGWCQLADVRSRSVYYTKVFARAAGAPADAAGSAFLAYLKQSHGLSAASLDRPAPVCQWRPEVTPYMVGKMQEEDKSAEILRNYRILDTGWSPP
jgi:hypothetical protein